MDVKVRFLGEDTTKEAAASASQGLRGVSEEAQKTEEKIAKLTQTASFQSRELSQLQKDLAAAKEKYGEDSEQAEKFQLRVDKLTASIKDNESAIANLKKTDAPGPSFLDGMLQSAAGLLAANVFQNIAGQVVSFGESVVKESADASEGQAQLEARLTATGGAAGVTADQANDLASKYQLLTKFTDDQILSSENMLLTFTNIGKDVFPDATQATLNLSQATGQDLTSSATQLGKALNNPVEGITALTRVGVTFTEQQKAQITAMVEAGQTADAQKIILNELQNEFGGAAEAAGQTLPGQLEILSHRFDDIKQSVGDALLPALTEFVSVLNSPEVQDAIKSVAAELSDNLGKAATGLAKDGLPVLIEGVHLMVEVLPAFVDNVKQAAQPVQDFITILKGAYDVIAPVFETLKNVAAPALDALGISSDKVNSVVGALVNPFGAVNAVLHTGAEAIRAHTDATVQAIAGDEQRTESLNQARAATTHHTEATKAAADTTDQFAKSGTAAYAALEKITTDYAAKSEESTAAHGQKLAALQADANKQLADLDKDTADKRTDLRQAYDEKIESLVTTSGEARFKSDRQEQTRIEEAEQDHLTKLSELDRQYTALDTQTKREQSEHAAANTDKLGDLADNFHNSQLAKEKEYQGKLSETQTTANDTRLKNEQTYQQNLGNLAAANQQKISELDRGFQRQQLQDTTELNNKLADMDVALGDKRADLATANTAKIRDINNAYNQDAQKDAEALQSTLADIQKHGIDVQLDAQRDANDRMRDLQNKLTDIQSKADFSTSQNQEKFNDDKTGREQSHTDKVTALQESMGLAVLDFDRRRIQQQIDQENERYAKQEEKAQADFDRNQHYADERLAFEQQQAQIQKGRDDQAAAEKLAQQQAALQAQADEDQRAFQDKRQRAQVAHGQDLRDQADAFAQQLAEAKQHHDTDVDAAKLADTRKRESQQQSLTWALQDQQQNYTQQQSAAATAHTAQQAALEVALGKQLDKLKETNKSELDALQIKYDKSVEKQGESYTKQQAADEQHYKDAKAKIDQSVSDENDAFTTKEERAASHYKTVLEDQESALDQQTRNAKSAYREQQKDLSDHYDDGRDKIKSSLKDRTDAENASYDTASKKRTSDYDAALREQKSKLGDLLISMADYYQKTGKMTGDEATAFKQSIEDKYGSPQKTKITSFYTDSKNAIDDFVRTGGTNYDTLWAKLDKNTKAVSDYSTSLKNVPPQVTTTLTLNQQLGQSLADVSGSADRAGERGGGTMPTTVPAPVAVAPALPTTPDGRTYHPGQPTPGTSAFDTSGKNISSQTLVFGYNGGSVFRDVIPGQMIPSGGDFKGYRRTGGPVSGGGAYMVGEGGPEMIVPEQNGTVIPNDKLGAIGNTTNNYFNMTVNTTAPHEPIIQDFQMMRSLAGVL